MLYSAVGQGCKYASLAMGAVEWAHYNLMPANPNQAVLLTKIPGHIHWLGSADGQSHWLGSQLGCHCKLGCRVDHTISQVL